MKVIWTGSIGFGLVNIPVKILSAVQNCELDLDMLDKKDKSNIHFQRVNTKKEGSYDETTCNLINPGRGLMRYCARR